MQRLEDDDLSRFMDIVVYGQRAIRHLGDIPLDVFVSDEKTFDSVVRCLAIIGEAAWKVTKPAQEQYSDIPWLQIAGMRHRLVHDYGEVDPTISYTAVTQYVPSLVERLAIVLREHGEDV